MTIKKIIIKTPFRNHKRVPTVLTGKSRTKSDMQAECDINNIMANIERSGHTTHVNKASAYYDDVSHAVDYQTAQNTIKAAELAFQALPARVRATFENDPAQFLEYAENPENLDGMVEMGLATHPKVPTTPLKTAIPAEETSQTAPPEGQK